MVFPLIKQVPLSKEYSYETTRKVKTTPCSLKEIPRASRPCSVMGKAEEVCVFCGEGWRVVMRAREKDQNKKREGRRGKHHHVLKWSTLAVHASGGCSPYPGQPMGTAGGSHHCCGFPTGSKGAADPARWSTDTAATLEGDAVLFHSCSGRWKDVLFFFNGKKCPYWVGC